MNKNAPVYVFAVALAYLAMLLVTAPAALVAQLVQRHSAAVMYLELAEGSLWNGKARAAHVSMGERLIVFSNPAWQIRWISLLRGELALAIKYESSGKLSTATVSWGRNRLAVEDTDLDLPFPLLHVLMPPMEKVISGGGLSLHTKQFVLGDNIFSGGGELILENAISPFSKLAPVGSYRFSLTGEKDRVVMRMKTERGALQMTGSGEWSRQGGVMFRGTADADPSRRSDLAPLLGLLGQEASGGARAIVFGSGGAR